MLPAEVERHRFTVEEYHRMGEAGIFGEDDRVELVEGEIVEMTPIGRRHADCVNRLTHLLVSFVGSAYVVSVQNPLRLGEHDEPEPDLALLKPGPELYSRGHPGSEDAALLIEVADSSLQYDRGFKLPLYARSGVPEAWLIDLRADRIEVHSGPGSNAGGYSRIHAYGRGENLEAATIAGLGFGVDEIMGGQD